MIKKFKGYHVLRLDPLSKRSFNGEKDLRRKFCQKTRMEDCEKINCGECLFCVEPNSWPNYDKTVFQEWHKAKGKVKYDEN